MHSDTVSLKRCCPNLPCYLSTSSCSITIIIDHHLPPSPSGITMRTLDEELALFELTGQWFFGSLETQEMSSKVEELQLSTPVETASWKRFFDMNAEGIDHNDPSLFNFDIRVSLAALHKSSCSCSLPLLPFPARMRLSRSGRGVQQALARSYPFHIQTTPCRPHPFSIQPAAQPSRL